MQGEKNRNRKKSVSPLMAIVIMLLAVLMGSIEDGNSPAIIFILGIIMVPTIAVLIAYTVKKKAGAAGDTTRPVNVAASSQSPIPQRQVKRSVKEFVPKQYSIFTKDAKLEEMSFSKRRMETTCEYGDMNHIFSHDQQQRLKQLDSFLKNGIIEREEYDIMKRKYLNPVEYR